MSDVIYKIRNRATGEWACGGYGYEWTRDAYSAQWKTEKNAQKYLRQMANSALQFRDRSPDYPQMWQGRELFIKQAEIIAIRLVPDKDFCVDCGSKGCSGV
jgi:hypothetical protein